MGLVVFIRLSMCRCGFALCTREIHMLTVSLNKLYLWSSPHLQPHLPYKPDHCVQVHGRSLWLICDSRNRRLEWTGHCCKGDWPARNSQIHPQNSAACPSAQPYLVTNISTVFRIYRFCEIMKEDKTVADLPHFLPENASLKTMKKINRWHSRLSVLSSVRLRVRSMPQI